jgi:pre-mRNA-splicing factor CWC26
MNVELSRQDRWGDPMLGLLEDAVENEEKAITKQLKKKKKEKKEMSEKEKRRAERKEEKKELRKLRKMDYEKKEKLMKKGVNPLNPKAKAYSGQYPENRFQIRPGFRWDGVDRSNRFEAEFFKKKALRAAQEEAAYRWATQDM